MNRRGIVLIVSFMVVVALAILGSVIMSRSVSERFIAQRYAESMKAFWLAEAGVNRALNELKADYNVSSGDCKWETNLGSGRYCVDLSGEDANGRRTLTAHGYIPSTTPSRAERKISVLVQSSGSNPSNPGLIQYAVDTTGSLDISGSAKTVPPELSHQGSNLDFDEVFGMSEDAVKALAVKAASEGNGYVYTDPPTNQLPVDGITWIELTGSNKFNISGQWSGTGLLIVNGNGSNVALEITGSGNMTFTGMIWVIGKVKIAGKATITGAIFAESMTGIESEVTGNSTISFSIPAVEGAFGLLGGGSAVGLDVLSWREL
jgi:Tfp pilus assembly protein PilX